MARVIDLRAADKRARIGPDFRARVKLGLLTSASFGNPGWWSDINMNRFTGPWLFAPIEPGITTGVPQISNSFQSPTLDTRKDFWIKGLTHFASTTPLSGALAVQGGRKIALEAFTVGGDGSDGTPATGTLALRTQVQKQAQAVHVEAFAANYVGNPVDQDGLFMGGAAGARLTASISGYYMTVTGLAGLSYNSKNAALAGDVLIGGTIQTGAQVPGTRVVDWGKCNAIGSISGTTMTTTSEVGAPIYGDSSDGMTVMIDGGVVVGKVTGGSSPNWTISNSGGVTVPAGSRIFIESRGGRGSYLMDTSQTVASTSIDFFPPEAGWYGVPPDVPSDRTAIVAVSYGPIVTRQTISVTGTKGSNLCKWVYGANPASGLNSGSMSSLAMTGATTASITLSGPIQAATGTNKGAWAKNTAYVAGDQVTSGGRTYIARTGHTSGNQANTTFDTERALARWVAPNTAIAGWYPMGAWASGTAYLAGDVVTQGGKLYFCCNSHTAATFSTDFSANRWSTMSGWTFKITASGYDPVNPTAPQAGTTQVLPVGHFNRDWNVALAGITVGDGTSGTIIPLVCDNTYTGNLPASNAVANLASTYTYSGVVTPPQAIFTGAPINGAKPLDGKEPGEHADSLGQMDADKFAAFLGTDRIRATSSYQAGGITSASGIQDTTEESSRIWWKWVLGLTPGEDPSCNIVWSGMQQVVIQKPKRYAQTYVDVGDRTWVDWTLAPFPNASLRPTATEAATGYNVKYGNDVAAAKNFMRLGGGQYSGGHYQGPPPSDFAPASAIGFNATTSLAWGGRDPAASEMLSMSFQHDTGDTLVTASGGTHIGWVDLTCSANFPGKLADGSRTIVDPVPTANFVGLGSSVASREMVRGRQAVPIGNNPVYIDCTVRGKAITKRFGPFNVPGAPAAASTTLSVAAQPAPAAFAGTSSPYTFAAQPIGATASDRDVLVAVIMQNSGNRTITSVKVDGVTASVVGFSSIINTTQGTRSEVWFYKARVTTANTTGDIVVSTSAGVNSIQIYHWVCYGVGVIYDAATATGAAANVGASVAVATPAGGAVLATHAYNSGTSGATFRGSAMTLTGTGNSSALTVAGTVTSTSNIDWNVGTEFVSAVAPGTPGSGDLTIKGALTGASLLSAIVLGPAVALDANFIAGTLGGATITRASIGTAVNAAGVITTSGNNVGRFDYSLGILRGLYVEPARTNLALFSNDLSSAWTFTSSSRTGGQADPAGGSGAALITCNGSSDPTVTLDVATGNLSGRTFTFSFWAKVVTPNAGTANSVRVWTYGTPTLEQVADATIAISGTTWARYSVTRTFPAGMSSTIAKFRIDPFDGATGATNTPAAGSSIALFGMQIEEASDASSYIPTTSATVTRSADTLNLTGLSKANGTYTARCWHISGDYTDVAGVTVSGGAATLSGISTKPVQGVTLQ